MRLRAARGLKPRRIRAVQNAAAAGWPTRSPGAANAWLVLITTKPPTWEDQLVAWHDKPPAVGDPHEGFFYPDPLGFWAEVRRWTVTLLRRSEPAWGMSEALSISALVHQGDNPGRLERVRQVTRPAVLLFLDDTAYETSGISVDESRFVVPDPHRAGQSYTGLWGCLPDGTVVGKSPQHPTMHRLYDHADMDAFLGAAPATSAQGDR